MAPTYQTEYNGAGGGSPASLDYVLTQALSRSNPLGDSMAGPLQLVNQTTAPAAVAGASVLYSIGGVLTYVNPQGLVNTLVGSQGGATAAGTAINTTAAETVLQTMTLPAVDAVAGAVYRQKAWGVYGWTATPTLAFGSRLGGVGGTALAAVPAITLGTAQTNATWHMESEMNFLSTTTAQTYLKVTLGTTSAADVGTVYIATPTAATTVSLTTTKTWVTTVTWGTSSSSNTIQLLGGYTERVA